MTDVLIYKYWNDEVTTKCYLRKNGVIYCKINKDPIRIFTPDTLIRTIKFKTNVGKEYINIDMIRKICGITTGI